MLKLEIRYQWQSRPDQPLSIEPVLFRVLNATRETGSLAGAARKVAMSYRHVWGLMAKWERIFGRSMVVLRQGKGAQLTTFGAKLLWAEHLVQAKLTAELHHVGGEIGQALAQTMAEAPPRLSVHASHDLALAQLRDKLAEQKGLQLDLHVKGSIDSLAALAKNQCILAGFHIAEGMEQSAAARFRHYLNPRQFRLIGLATRVQGLMLAPGNPKRILSLADLMQKDVCFINRQADSGSRLEFDQLLSGAGIAPSSIKGYRDVEFTHLAVAATVATNKADACYGIKAAALSFKLDFIPMLTERYYLACRKEALDNPAIADLIGILGGSDFKGIVNGLGGYGTAISGKLYDITKVMPAKRPPHRLPAALKTNHPA